MIRRPPRSTQSRSSAASDVYKRQELHPCGFADLGQLRGLLLHPGQVVGMDVLPAEGGEIAGEVVGHTPDLVQLRRPGAVTAGEVYLEGPDAPHTRARRCKRSLSRRFSSARA